MERFFPLLIIITSLSLFLNIVLILLFVWFVEKYDQLYRAVISSSAVLDTLINQSFIESEVKRERK